MTICRLVPHPDQIRYYAQSALNGFETLALEDAVSNAQDELREILNYLDRTDETVRVADDHDDNPEEPQPTKWMPLPPPPSGE